MATLSLEIPLTATPQKLSIKLNGITYQLTVVWNWVAQCWMLSIADQAGIPIINSIAMVLGSDLLEQFEYLNFGGKLIVTVDNNSGIPPTFTNLGTEGHLLFEVVENG